MTDVFTGLTGSGDMSLPTARWVPLIGVNVTTFPAGAAVMDATAPRRIMKVGWIAPGRLASDPSWPSSSYYGGAQWIDFERELFTYGFPGIYCDRIRYHLEPGAVATVYVNDTEVPAMAALKAPWDRNPTFWRGSNSGIYNGSTTTTAGFTYTVPAGRKLLVQQASARVQRVTASTTVNGGTGTLLVNTLSILRASLYSNVPGEERTHDLAAGPLLLSAGEVISSTYAQTDDGGTMLIDVRAAGFTFDA